MRCLVWVISAICALQGCARKNEVTPERCTELRDHVVDLRLATLTAINSAPVIPSVGSNHVSAPPAKPIDVAGHRAALNQGLGDAFTASCMKNMNVDQLSCALAATSSDAIDRCMTVSK